MAEGVDRRNLLRGLLAVPAAAALPGKAVEKTILWGPHTLDASTVELPPLRARYGYGIFNELAEMRPDGTWIKPSTGQIIDDLDAYHDRISEAVKQAFNNDLPIDRALIDSVPVNLPTSLTAEENNNMADNASSGRQDTLRHIDLVRAFMNKATANLVHRAAVHDASKLQEPEASSYDAMTDELRGVPYGSDEYRAIIKKYKPAVEHHYANNSHHPEYYADGVNGMSLLDVLEMLLDWKAASMRQPDKPFDIEFNVKRFNISPQLADILRNTVRELKLTDTQIQPTIDENEAD